MCFRQKCGFLTFYIMCSTKNVKPNVSKPSCLNERTSKQFFTDIKRQKNIPQIEPACHFFTSKFKVKYQKI